MKIRDIMSETTRSPIPTGTRNPQQPVYLRIGDWDPDNPYSRNYAIGDIEAGLSVYELDPLGQPVVPEEGEWAEDDMTDRLSGSEPKYLVQGQLVGQGHDGEPLLGNVIIVGMWE